jgi:hypothetical protein
MRVCDVLSLIGCSLFSVHLYENVPPFQHGLNSIERLVKNRFPWSDLIVLEKQVAELPTCNGRVARKTRRDGARTQA